MIGIDLGTTNSLCAIFHEGQPKLIPNAHGKVLTPSVVGVLENGQVVVGDAAKELRITQPDRCAARFKRYMGSDEKIQLGSHQFTAPQLSSLVLKSLRHDAEQFLGQSVTDAVITVPAYFNDLQRRATRLAGELAGLNVRRIVNEPTAAALTYGFHDRSAMRHLMVVDLGGGTFDVTIMEIFEGTLEILSTAGESMLGGEDFTDRLVAEVLRRRGMHVEQAEMREPLRVSRLRQNCELAKTMFATHNKYQINFPDAKGLRTDDEIEINREEFDALSKPLLERLAAPLQRALRDSNRTSQQIDDVILVGGATRMPCLRDFLVDRLNCQPKMDFNPDQVVALGAAVQAALLAEDRAVNDMLLTDVCPHTLGVEVVKRFGQQVLEGYYSPIIHRNTTLPVSQEHVFSTAEPFQQSVRLRVYQGEGRKVRDNQLLGELTIDGFPPQTESVEFIVRFTYDLNGILEVEAIVPLTGKKFRAVLTQSKGLTQSQIDAAVEEMQKIKFYPRDELENQRLLRYCERLVGEVSPFYREEFEAAIDYWEQAMSSGDREHFELAKQGLLTLISQLGFDFDGSAEDSA